MDDEELPMDCHLARTLLDAARPDAQDRGADDLQAAFAHVDDCAACAEAVEFHRKVDRRLGAVIRSVEVPADLQDRLLASLAAAQPQPMPTQAGSSRPVPRRAWLSATSAAVLLVAVAGAWWFGRPQPAPLAAADVLGWCREHLNSGDAFEQLSQFDGDFESTVGDGRWTSLLAEAVPRGADIDGDGRQDIAVYTIRGGGFLAVLPPDRVSDPPGASSGIGASKQYSPAPHVAWTQDRQMYVCYLHGGSAGQLRDLLQRVYGSAA